MNPRRWFTRVFLRPVALVAALLTFAAPSFAVAIDDFVIKGVPDWSKANAQVEIDFSHLLEAGIQTVAINRNYNASIDLFSAGVVTGSGLGGSLIFRYTGSDGDHRIETDFRFSNLGASFRYTGPASEWRLFDPQFYTGGEKIFTDVTHPAALPYLDFSYDSVTDTGRILWSASPVPDAAATILLLLAGLAGGGLLRRRMARGAALDI